jgi:urease accessory protein
MLELTEITSQDMADDEMTLTYEARQKCRLLSRTDSGREIGLFLPRGQVLRHGLILTGHDHYRVRIKAAPENVSIVRSQNSLAFARACYHLGNRHVPLQILAGELRYLTDHVLDQMLEGLGFQILYDTLPFEPEQGAYHTQHGH